MYCNWGILGPGFIATRAVIPAMQEVSNSRILAVASSNESRAKEVALCFGIERYLKQMLEAHELGDVRYLHAAFSFNFTAPGNYRAYKQFGGGALLDVGSYCVNDTIILLIQRGSVFLTIDG